MGINLNLIMKIEEGNKGSCIILEPISSCHKQHCQQQPEIAHLSSSAENYTAIYLYNLTKPYINGILQHLISFKLSNPTSNSLTKLGLQKISPTSLTHVMKMIRGNSFPHLRLLTIDEIDSDVLKIISNGLPPGIRVECGETISYDGKQKVDLNKNVLVSVQHVTPTSLNPTAMRKRRNETLLEQDPIKLRKTAEILEQEAQNLLATQTFFSSSFYRAELVQQQQLQRTQCLRLWLQQQEQFFLSLKKTSPIGTPNFSSKPENSMSVNGTHAHLSSTSINPKEATEAQEIPESYTSQSARIADNNQERYLELASYRKSPLKNINAFFNPKGSSSITFSSPEPKTHLGK